MQVFVKLDLPVKAIVASVALDSQEQKTVQVLQVSIWLNTELIERRE